MHARESDTVVAILGKNKEKTGKVLGVIPKTGKVIAKGVNLAKKHQKPNRQNMQGGITEIETAVDSSKVMLPCEKCKKVTRISHKLLEDSAKVRVCKKCGEAFQSLKGDTLRE